MRTPSALLQAILFAALCLASAVASADAALRSAEQLKFALSVNPPCCVVDARPAAEREARPIAEALAWRENLKLVPSATVVVVADSDQRALEIARRLAGAHPGATVVAVEGGAAAWESVLAAKLGEPPGGRALGFVIPKNTCEQGTPLQHLRTEPK